MHQDAYTLQARMAERHWWWEGRRRVLRAVISRLNLPPAPDILEIGCGSGSNLAMLASFGSVSATDPDARMVECAKANGWADVRQGGLPDGLPFGISSFDLVAMLDVLEHLDDDIEGLSQAAKCGRSGSAILLTVPAFPFLWGPLDELAEHRRRYRKSSLAAVCTAAGLHIEWISYFNTALFPLAIAGKLAERILGSSGTAGLSIPSEPINTILTECFALDAHALGRISLPWGLSLAALCRTQR